MYIFPKDEIFMILFNFLWDTNNNTKIVAFSKTCMFLETKKLISEVLQRKNVDWKGKSLCSLQKLIKFIKIAATPPLFMLSAIINSIHSSFVLINMSIPSAPHISIHIHIIIKRNRRVGQTATGPWEWGWEGR